MDLETALKKDREIATFLNIDGVKRRAGRGRVALGLAPDGNNGFSTAIRAWTEQDLEEEYGAGIVDKIRAKTIGEVDLKITGMISAAPPSEATVPGPLCIGASVGHCRGTAGTLGFFAQHADCTIGFVSNNHVVAESDHGLHGDEVLHPGPCDGGRSPDNVIGHLFGTYPTLQQKRGAVVDAAFVRLRDGIEYDPSRIGSSLRLKQTRVPIHTQSEVVKFGRSTKLTRGRITAFGLRNLDVDYPVIKRVFFDRQIEITPEDPNQRFSEHGDSGSLVVNPDGHPIGLLFAGSTRGLSYANPIEDVLSELRVTLLV